MKSVACLLISFLSLFVNAQPSKPDCQTANRLLDEMSGKYYWGSPKWLAVMDSAIHLCPTSARAWSNKGMVYLMRGEAATWFAHTEKAVELDPLYFLGNRAWHRMRYLRDYEGALADLLHQDSVANFYTVYVTDTHNYMLIGQCKEGMGDYAGALDYYNRGLEKQIKERGQDWVGTYDYLIRGILKFKMNDFEGAIADFDKQVRFYEQLTDTYYYRGLAYSKISQYDQARRDFEKAKTLMNGQGYKRWDMQVVLMNEIYLTDIQQALNKLN